MNDELPLSLDKPATPVAQFHALPPARLRFWLLVAAISAGLLYLLAPVLTPLNFSWMVTANPARALGLTGKGTLGVGQDADLLLIDPETLAIGRVMSGGQWRA